MRRPASVFFAFAALLAWGVISAPLVSVASTIDGSAARIETISASAVPLVTGTGHVFRSGTLSGVTPPASVVTALAIGVLLGVLALTRPVARSHARPWSSRAPPRPLI